MMGVYASIKCFLTILSSFSIIFGSQSFRGSIPPIIVNLVTIVILVLLAFALIKYSDKIANVLYPTPEDFTAPPSISSIQIMAICFSSIAVFLFIQAISNGFFVTIQFVTMLKHIPDNQRVYPTFLNDFFSRSLPYAVQFALAILLFFKSSTLANYCHKIQAGKCKNNNTCDQ
jgi:hypothetical protein